MRIPNSHIKSIMVADANTISTGEAETESLELAGQLV